ncbi:hypothetical protein HMPREF3190_01708 [Umbribacter vaginalis]|nr:hypothetical protein HMPREF3190_01708 [Coriobacteriales bacterium DNF00809]
MIAFHQTCAYVHRTDKTVSRWYRTIAMIQVTFYKMFGIVSSRSVLCTQ